MAALAFLEFGSWLFWLLFLSGPILLLYWLEDESFGYLWSATVVLGLLLFFGVKDFHPVDWVGDHPRESIVGFVGYFIAGIAYGFAKWFSFVRDVYDRYVTYKREELADRAQTAKTYDRKFDSAAHEKEIVKAFMNYQFRGRNIPPVPNQHIDKIINWMAYWPLSLTWTLINDPIRRIARWLYKTLFAGWYTKISHYVFRDLKEFQEKQIPLEK